MENTLAVIMAGGHGERMSVLAQERAKPAIPFGGKYRIIDFVLSNCVNSGISNIAVLTQYQPLSLADHIAIGLPWGFGVADRTIRLLQPYLTREESRDWYKGTADAVYQNLAYIGQQNAERIFILSGDHVYKMNYLPMLELHNASQADVTIAVMPMPEEDLVRFGTVEMDGEGRVTGFQEKVKNPRSNYVNMGIYVFNREVLQAWLEEIASPNRYDFGRHVFPRMVRRGRIFAYIFDGFWRDVGTVQAYWQASMEVLDKSPGYLMDENWPIRTVDRGRAPAHFGEAARVTRSLVSEGCVVNGTVEHSVISPGVRIAEGAVVRDSVIMDDTGIGNDCIIDRCVLDKGVTVGAGSRLGYGDDFRPNRQAAALLYSGITVVGKRAVVPSETSVGRNCVLHAGLAAEDFPGKDIPSGEMLRPRRRRARPA